MDSKTIYIGDRKIIIKETKDNNGEELYIAYENGAEVGRNNIEDQLIFDLRQDDKQ